MPPCADWKCVSLAGDVAWSVECLHWLRRKEGGSEGLFPRNPINTQKNDQLRIKYSQKTTLQIFGSTEFHVLQCKTNKQTKRCEGLESAVDYLDCLHHMERPSLKVGSTIPGFESGESQACLH